MPDPWSPERRRNERREIPFPLHARVVGGDVENATGTPLAAQTAPLRVSGLSVGGMVVESPAAFPVGRRLVLMLDAPDAALGPLPGRVVHSRLLLGQGPGAAPTYVAGIAFDRLAPDVFEAIEAVLFSIGHHAATGGADDAQ